ncbi:hypothetical protein DPM19_04810 [Actinomadura craniellae]|uniref:Peptidase inhibitor family I36 protein n=2 Tax=Actinomadura craniellae TaxID=2231787 RepID=A0A365HD82_9ACTN|nr:hypothetical protein DPM19_04810 [Actinomadura craniellae]
MFSASPAQADEPCTDGNVCLYYLPSYRGAVFRAKPAEDACYSTYGKEFYGNGAGYGTPVRDHTLSVWNSSTYFKAGVWPEGNCTGPWAMMNQFSGIWSLQGAVQLRVYSLKRYI